MDRRSGPVTTAYWTCAAGSQMLMAAAAGDGVRVAMAAVPIGAHGPGERQDRPMRVTVVGGGIAGLTCALSLHAAGFEPQVCESARAVEAVGVGINLLPHAVRELSELGLARELATIALPPHRLSYRDRTGEPVWEEPLGTAAGYRWPQHSVHRGRLHMLLLAAVRERLGPDAVRTGLRFRRFEQSTDGVRAHFLDRTNGLPAVEDADVLVGADGIDSAVRAQLHPGEGPPTGNGVHMWRGVAHHCHILDGRSIVVAGGTPGAKFVVYPIEDPATAGGDALMNWVLEVRHGPSAPPPGETGRRITTAEAHAAMASWNLPWIDLGALVEHSSAILEYPMLDRDPLARWSFGRVTLVGDAAHPMFPMGMNGGSQSIVDTRVLAWCLARESGPAAALRRYDRMRRPTVNAVVLANRELGPEEIIARAVDHGGPLPAGRAEEIATRYRRLAQATAAQVNSHTSWTIPSPATDRARPTAGDTGTAAVAEVDRDRPAH
ncbi:2-polyprenyl-6-methoxyphenol hydroxylase-like FAD-dependent oxidoreductase [Streptomyces netropsis]|uniref:2-polyprenyl-6-methoxyphenol hydroxylase-like FAD-dependent oxidoreductase n=2 Tax=Streptomyces netropsis TaxID=55404 RepID=A0A7W7LGB0_STRNE|nr:FAD-dependent monooxygenase [Streptomyces netropsis]MBB4889151.1 2-polyprenyl-6-methoxyphenol hydroxylase-like FAD-dependent oxidoreductase [Streptomyces netropsis]